MRRAWLPEPLAEGQPAQFRILAAGGTRTAALVPTATILPGFNQDHAVSDRMRGSVGTAPQESEPEWIRP